MKPPIPPEKSADEHQQGQSRAAETDLLGQAVNGEGRVAIHPPIACLARLPRGGEQAIGVIELRQQAIEGGALFHGAGCLLSAPALAAVGLLRETNSRISKTAIIGRKRMNRKNSAKNRPMVPRNVVQSQMVG